MKKILIAFIILFTLNVSAQSFNGLDAALYKLKERSDSMELCGKRILLLDMDEAIALSFCQDVGDLNIIQRTSKHLNQQITYIDIHEINNVMLWYDANKQYFQDGMYEEYLNIITDQPKEEKIYLSVPTATPITLTTPYSLSDDYGRVVPLLQSMHNQFLKLKYSIE